MKQKNTLFIILFFALSLGISAQSDQDKAKAYFKQASAQFSQNQYSDCIATLDKVEGLLGSSNARVSSLKVKAYFNNKQYAKAKEELNKFFEYRSAESLKNEMLDYIVKIESAEERERLNAIAREKERQRLAQIQEEKETLQKVDKTNWNRAKTINSEASYQEYLDNGNNKIYRSSAKKKIKELEQQTAEGLVRFYNQYTDNDRGELRIGENTIKTSGSYYNSNYNKRIFYQRTGSLDRITSVEVDKFNRDEPWVYFTGKFKRYVYIVKNGNRKEFVTAAARAGGYKKGRENYVSNDYVTFASMTKAKQFADNFKKFLTKRKEVDELNEIIAKANAAYKNENFTEAFTYTEKAAELGNKPAMYNLAYYYHEGIGTEKNDELAKKYYLSTLRIDPNHEGANQNMGVLILSKEQSIIDEINKNIDNTEEYNRLIQQRLDLFEEALPYIKKAYQINNSEDLKETIKSIENALQGK